LKKIYIVKGPHKLTSFKESSTQVDSVLPSDREAHAHTTDHANKATKPWSSNQMITNRYNSDHAKKNC